MRHQVRQEQIPGRIPKKRRRLPLLPLLGTLVVVLVIVNVAVVLTRQQDRDPAATSSDRLGADPVPTTPLATQNATTAGTKKQARLGVFVGTDAAAASSFEKWLGKPVQDVLDFSHRDSWEAIADPQYVLSEWSGSKYRLVYAVPMLPNTLAATKDTAMANGAAGQYDQYFKRLAENLVQSGHQNAVLRIGWEFNLKSWAWGIDDPEVFVTYFRRVVTVMRSVPGQKFNINWNPNNGFNPYDGVKYWPGNGFVDSIGVDIYDVDRHQYPYPKNCNAACREQRQLKAWDEALYGGPRGLSYWSFFARQHKKPFSVPEWSMWIRNDGTGGGDNPTFLKQMQFFLASPANNVAFSAYFNRNSGDGKHELQKYYPQGSKAFKKLFGKTT